jgi:hypothetical protein
VTRRWGISVFVLTAAIGAVPAARSQIIDMGGYPDIAGGWGRSEVYQWARGEVPPLTPEYQAAYQANRAD